MIITNLINVWWRESEASVLQDEWKKNAPTLGKTDTKRIVAVLEDLLCKHNAQKKRHHVACIEQVKIKLSDGYLN